jgi:arabinan endo-1,5-alpha-L-arabinosidase
MTSAATRGLVLVLAGLLAAGAAGCSAPGASDDAADGGASGGEAAGSPLPFALDADFPDPDVLRTGDDYFAYATNGSGFNVQVAESADLEEWTTVAQDALPVLPAWSLPGKTWAPDVSEPTPGNFVMYFTVANRSPQLQCIGVATATAPGGPFTPAGDAPIVCPTDEGGAIDPATFTDDDGTRYLVWKNDGNCCGLDTWLQLAELSPDGITIVGETSRLAMQDQAWEGNLIEAPTLVKRDDAYVLFYSANDYGGEDYATGYATATELRGPYVKPDEPLLSTDAVDGKYLGPGGQDVVEGPDGGDVLVFHSWDELFIERGINSAALTWDSGVPKVVVP